MEDISQHCPFIQFTHDLLAKAELNQVVYHLQHDSGFNINIILYLLWLAKARYGRLSKRNVKALQIKQELQEEIIKAHLVEQRMLYDSQLKTHPLRRSLQQQLADGCMSMIHYCELKNDLLLDDDQTAFIQLFSAVFNDLARTEVEKQILLAFDRLKTEQPAQLMWQEF